jgi:hypothetical protein
MPNTLSSQSERMRSRCSACQMRNRISFIIEGTGSGLRISIPIMTTPRRHNHDDAYNVVQHHTVPGGPPLSQPPWTGWSAFRGKFGLPAPRQLPQARLSIRTRLFSWGWASMLSLVRRPCRHAPFACPVAAPALQRHALATPLASSKRVA